MRDPTLTLFRKYRTHNWLPLVMGGVGIGAAIFFLST